LGQGALLVAVLRTLDRPLTIALLKPLTGTSDIALRLVGVDEPADAPIISRNILRPDEQFIPLWVERYVAALLPSHPLTLKERLRTSDLAGAAMIDRCHCEQSELFGRAASGKRQPAAIAESEDWAMALVAAGVGIAIVPEGVARANSDVAVRGIDVDVKREVGLAYSAAQPPSAALQNFIARLQRERSKARRAKPAKKVRRKDS
jgi:DNA-binding transcriptional LysR family regulator